MAEELLGGGLDIDGKAFESDQIITQVITVYSQAEAGFDQRHPMLLTEFVFNQ